MSTPQTSAFLKNLRASGLVDDAQLAEIESWTSTAGADNRALAQELVNRKVLTKFQAERILAGRTEGFIIGPYVVTDKIGAGGMGKVYKAVHREMGRTVAVKVLPRSLRMDTQARARFMREVRACAQLNHPNIVAAYDVGEHDDIIYLVMEYVSGTDLYTLIRQHGRLTAHRAADIAYQVALALQHASRRGIVHRDIKPPNILITDKGTAKVLDMGLARIEHREGDGDRSGTLTQEGVVMGTVDYIAPEQAQDTHGADTRADIYSLGCTLYHMLTGRVPFPGGTAAEKLYRHLMAAPEDPTKLAPDLPRELAAVVGRMIAKRPEDRFQTPAEVATALLPWVGPSTTATDDPEPGPSVSQPTTVAYGPDVLASLVDGEPGAPPEDPSLATSLGPRPSSPARRRVPIWVWVSGNAAVVLLIGAIALWPRATPPRARDAGAVQERSTSEPATEPPVPASRPVARAPAPEPVDRGPKRPPPKPPRKTIPAPAPAPAEPVLLVVDPDGGPYNTLKQALGACKPDQRVVIEVRTNKVLDVPGLYVKCRDLTLTAGKGFRPILRRPRTAPGQGPLNMLRFEATESIAVSELHFVPRIPGSVLGNGLHLDAPNMQVTNCTFRKAWMIGGNAIYTKTPGGHLLVRDCFFSGFSPFLQASMHVARVAVVNCVDITPCTTMEFHSAGSGEVIERGVTLHLERNTIVAGPAREIILLSLFRCSPQQHVPKTLTIDLQGNVILPCPKKSFRPLVGAHGTAMDKVPWDEELRKAIQWQGSNNVLGQCTLAVGEADLRPGEETVYKPVVRTTQAFVRSWAPGLARGLYQTRMSASFTASLLPWDGWPIDHLRRTHVTVRAKSRGVGADLSKIPAPPPIPPGR